MQYAVIDFVKKLSKGMLLIDMPTGTGKTYETREIIKSYLEEKILDDIPLVIYVTPLKKNVDDIYNKLKDDLIDNAELFDKNVLRIHANYECVLDLLLEKENEIQKEIRNKESYKNLKNKIITYKSYENNKNLPSDILSTSLMEIRKIYEPKFRKDLEEEIKRAGKTIAIRKQLLNHEYAWVKEIYPSCLIEDRKVLFMTMDKFISGNDPIINKPYSFLTYPKLKGALVFIDEFDSTKDVILNQEIERCTDYKLDMARLFSGISTALKGKEFPMQLFGESEEAIESFEKMKKRIIEVESDYDLNYIFKLESNNENDRYFLFDDYQLHTITSTKEKGKITFKTDKSKKHNLIKIIEKDKKDDGRFYRSIYAMKGALNYFLTCCAMLSKNYMHNFNNHVSSSNQDKMEIEQAVSTIVDPFNLDRNMAETISRMIIDNISLPKDKRFKDIFSTDFYLDGFRYYDFNDDLSHDASTSFLMCYMNNTPEKIMLSLADKAHIVGLSATASIQTVTGNYNIEYLKEELNENYYELSEKDEKRIKDKVNKKLLNNYKINVKIEENSGEEIEENIKSIFSQPDYIEKYVGIFQNYLGEQDYQVKRLFRTIKGIKDFINNDESKVILVLTNKNIKCATSSDVFNEELMSNIVKDLSLENNKKVPKLHHLFGNDFEIEKKAYNDEIKEGEKIILFSSYPSVGTGQNLQYEENQGEDIVEKDIDSIYIENPRNILVLTENLKEEKELMKYIYQMETLKKNGEINSTSSLKNIKSAFKKFNNPVIPFLKFDNYAYNTDSVNNHRIKVLVQAIGRICRTNGDNKIHDVNIYVDDEIFTNIDFKCMEGRLMNPEFEEIVKKTNKPGIQSKELKLNLNKAVECNLRVNKRIENILSENKTTWILKDIEKWREARDFVLKHPTISRNELHSYIQDSKIKGLKDFYLSALSGETINAYQYMPNYDPNDIEEDFFAIQYLKKRQKGYVIIDEEECRLKALMRIPFVKMEFEKKGYATSFEPNELMILPVIYQNIYKGALGEEAGKIILEYFGIKLKEINDEAKFEKFDYQLTEDENIYIDFKNWSENDEVNKSEYTEKCRNKLELIKGKAAFIINIVSSNFIIKENGSIYEVSSLTKKNNRCAYMLDDSDAKKLVGKMLEVINNGNN